MFLKKLFNKDKKEITITVSEVETKTAINNSNNIEQVELTSKLEARNIIDKIITDHAPSLKFVEEQEEC